MQPYLGLLKNLSNAFRLSRFPTMPATLLPIIENGIDLLYLCLLPPLLVRFLFSFVYLDADQLSIYSVLQIASCLTKEVASARG